MLQDRLLEVAIDRFGRLGFEGAATREIAKAAGTAMSSITYHFGGKEGLYLACADYIAKQIGVSQAPVFDGLGDPEALDRDQAVSALLTIVDSFAVMMLSPASQGWARFIVREQHEPTEAFERLWGGVMSGLLTVTSKVLGRVRSELTDRECRAEIMLLFGQTMVLRAARASVLKALDTHEINEADGLMLRRQIRRNTMAILTSEID